MAWIWLIIAGFSEVGFTTCLAKANQSDGWIKNLWLMGFLAFLSASMLLLYRAIQTIPIGTAYAVWTGIGAFGSVLIGILFFNEPYDFYRIFFLTLLVCSIVGLKFFA